MSLASQLSSLATRVAHEIKLKAPLANPTFSGTVVTPNLRVSGGSPAEGKVLVSNSAGVATWQNPPSPLVPYDLWVRHLPDNMQRSVSWGETWIGFRFPRDVLITSYRHRFRTADASGSTTISVRKGATTIAGGSQTITAANQTIHGTEVSLGSGVLFSKSDILRIVVDSVGITPGFGLDTIITGQVV